MRRTRCVRGFKCKIDLSLEYGIKQENQLAVIIDNEVIEFSK